MYTVLVYVHPDVQTCYWLDIKSSSQKHVVLAIECAQVWSNISLADSLHKIWSTNDYCIYTIDIKPLFNDRMLCHDLKISSVYSTSPNSFPSLKSFFPWIASTAQWVRLLHKYIQKWFFIMFVTSSSKYFISQKLFYKLTSISSHTLGLKMFAQGGLFIK